MTPSLANARAVALHRFADDFARGAYWDAHEHLETLWRDDREDLWQALIQLAAAFVLLGSGRSAGGLRVLTRAQLKLAPLPATLHGVDVAWLRERYATLADLLGQPPSGDLAETAALPFAQLFLPLAVRLGCDTVG